MAKTKVHGEFLKDSVVRFTAKAGENITKGQAVYISGISGEVPVVSLADANDTAKMPAFGLAEATVSTNAEVEITSFGTLKGLDTSSYSLGDILYVDTTAGSLTNNPSGLEATKLQNIGMVQRVHASNGSIKVGGAGRTNAVPNLDDGDIFIGDSNNKAVSDTFTNVLNTEAGINSSANATAITIDSSENVGIGTNSPNTYSGYTTLTLNGTSGSLLDFEVNGTHTGEIYADGTTVFGIQAIGSRALNFKTDNAERMRIDSLGNVGINNTQATAINNASGLGNLVVGSGSGAEGITIYSGSDSYGGLNFADATSGGGSYAGYIKFNHVDNSFGHFIGNTERMRIDSSGNLIMSAGGTIRAGGANDLILDAGESGTPDIYLQSGGSTKVKIEGSNGNVGIGLINQANKLQVDGDICIGKATTSADLKSTLKMRGANGSNELQVFDLVNDGENGRVDFKYNRAGNAAQTIMSFGATVGNVGIGTSSPTVGKLQVNDGSGAITALTRTSGSTSGDLGTIRFGNTDVDSNLVNIVAFQDGATNSGALKFETQASGGATAERMRIDSSGQVGIGTTSPDCKLHTLESTNNSGSTGLANGGLQIENTNTTSGSWSQLHLRSVSYDAHLRLLNDGTLKIMTDGNTSAMTILDGGNVGIGTTSPKELCDINGGGLVVRGALTNGAGSGNGLRFEHTSDIGQIYSLEPDVAWRELRLNASQQTFYIAGGEKMRINSSGNVLVGATSNASGQRLHLESAGQFGQLGLRHTSATSGKFWYVGPSSNNTFAIYNQTPAGVYLGDGATSWTGASDESLKENIVELTGALDKVKNFRCVEYNFISDETSSKKIGFIAQDWQEDYSQVVSQDPDGNLGIQYTETIPVLLKAIQEQQTQIDALQSEINLLKGE